MGCCVRLSLCTAETTPRATAVRDDATPTPRRASAGCAASLRTPLSRPPLLDSLQMLKYPTAHHQDIEAAANRAEAVWRKDVDMGVVDHGIDFTTWRGYLCGEEAISEVLTE